MARAPVSITVQDGSGNALSSASITARIRDTVNPASLFDASTGGSAILNPYTTTAMVDY